MSKLKESAASIATNNRTLEILLVLLVCGVLVSNFPEGMGFFEQLSCSIVITLIMITAAFLLARKTIAPWFAGIMATLGLASHWIQYLAPSRVFIHAEIYVSLIFFILLDRAVLIRIFDQSPVDRYKIEGAIVVYLLTIAIWAQLYLLTELWVPGSFQFNPTALPHDFETTRENLVYLSFSTMTTLGIGDILPLSSLARTLVSLEATFGVLFPNIFIARLVSLEIIYSKHGK